MATKNLTFQPVKVQPSGLVECVCVLPYISEACITRANSHVGEIPVNTAFIDICCWRAFVHAVVWSAEVQAGLRSSSLRDIRTQRCWPPTTDARARTVHVRRFLLPWLSPADKETRPGITGRHTSRAVPRLDIDYSAARALQLATSKLTGCARKTLCRQAKFVVSISPVPHKNGVAVDRNTPPAASRFDQVAQSKRVVESFRQGLGNVCIAARSL